MKKQIKPKRYTVGGQPLTGEQWLEKMQHEFDAILKYQDDLDWYDDEQKHTVVFTLKIVKA